MTFLRKFIKNKVKAEGPLFQDEVKHFKAILKQAQSFCDKKTAGNLKVVASRWNQDFVFTKSDCDLMKLEETKFINNLRVRHKLMNDIR